MASQTNAQALSTPSALAYQAALDGLRAELMAMPEEEVERKPLLDASAAAVVAEASANKLAAFRAALVAKFGEEAGTLADELPTVARATRQADIELAGTAPTTDLSTLHEQVRAEYQLLITDADSLANRKLIDPQRLDAARDIQGYEHHYEELRRMMTHLRWYQDDADAITPSFWAGRRRRSRSEGVVETTDAGTSVPDVAPPAAPVTPSPINGGGPFNP